MVYLKGLIIDKRVWLANNTTIVRKLLFFERNIMDNQLFTNNITLPDVNVPPMPAIASPGIIYNGKKAEGFTAIDQTIGHPDVRSFRRKFGLIIPATNTSMEHELWTIIGKNPEVLRGIGLHTSNVVTPKPKLETEADLMAYKEQFLNGVKAAVDVALLAQPQYMIMGMSLEHIIEGLNNVRAPAREAEDYSGLAWSFWHDAANKALNKFGAKRIGIISPFDKTGSAYAAKMFEDLGFTVVANIGFSCANAVHIAHIPDSAKEEAILNFLATKENKLDAIVQCGTNMSMSQVAHKLEPVINIPILGINAVLLWHALRQTGISDPFVGAGQIGL